MPKKLREALNAQVDEVGIVSRPAKKLRVSYLICLYRGAKLRVPCPRLLKTAGTMPKLRKRVRKLALHFCVRNDMRGIIPVHGCPGSSKGGVVTNRYGFLAWKKSA